MRSVYVTLISLLFAVPGFATPKLVPAPKNPVPEEYLIVLQDKAAQPSVDAAVTVLAERYGAKVLRTWTAVPSALLKMPEAAARKLADDPRVLTVEQDYRFEAFSSTPDCNALEGQSPPGTPLQITRGFPSSSPTPPWQQAIDCTSPSTGACNDNWGLDRIDQASGLDGKYNFSLTGSGVKVYVIDGGVYSANQDFADRHTGVSRVATGYNATDRTTDTADCFPHGHGTHVAGIIGGLSSGVAKDAILVPVRYTTCGTESNESRLSWLMEGFNWIAQQQAGQSQTAIANLSSNDLGWRESVTLRQEIKAMTNAGVLLIQSASNESTQSGFNFIPMDACPWTLIHPELDERRLVVVGGTDSTDARWMLPPSDPSYHDECVDPSSGLHECGSNVGRCLDLWAPAAYIVSTSKEAVNGYCSLSGTSMAAPHAAGVAALFLQIHPNAPPEEVKAALLASASQVNGLISSGYPAVDAAAGPSPNLLLSSNFPVLGGAVATDDRLFVVNGSPLQVSYSQLLANDFDWQGRPLSVVRVDPPLHGTITTTANGFTYDPGAYVGSESFTYEVSDGNGVVTGNITAVNARPVAVDDHFILGLDSRSETYTLQVRAADLLANDYDVDGPSSSLSLVSLGQPSFGTLTCVDGTPAPGYCAPGAWNYDPHLSTGTASVSYTIKDGDQRTATGTLFITTYTAISGSLIGTAGSELVFTTQDVCPDLDSSACPVIDVLANDTSADGTLFIDSVTPPGNGSYRVVNNKIVYKPNYGFAGYDSFTYVVRNSTGNLGAASVVIEVRPKPPGPVARPDSYQAQRNTPLVIGYAGLLANDSGSGLTVMTSHFTTPLHGTLAICCSAEGFTYTPATGYVGPDSFQYTIQDNAGRQSSATISIDVAFINHPPVVGNDSVVTEHDTPITIPVLANDSDQDGDTLQVVAVTQPAHGTVVINGGSTVTYTPNLGYAGPDPFTYTVQDSHNATATGQVSLSVRSQNVPPVAVDDPFSSPRNAQLAFTCAQLLANDHDSDADPALGDHLTVTAIGPSPAGTLVCTSCSCTFTPPAGLTGLINIPYNISDGRPGGTASANVKVTVFNRAPVANPDVANTPPNTTVTINVRANDSDPDGDPITVNAITSQPAAGTGTCSVASGGTGVVYTPPAGFTASTSCSYTVTDGLATSAPATITIYINRPPIARGDQLRVPFATQIQIAHATLLANDFDPDGDPLTISSFDTTGMNGTLSCPTGTTTCTYTPPGGYYTAVTSFRYTATDGKNGFSTATVKLKVGVVQSVPVASDDLLTTALNMPKAFTILDVLANDTDADGDVLTASIGSGPRDYGSMSCNTFNCTYTPNTGFVGMDRFFYTASDGADGSATAWIKMMVLPPTTPTFDAREDLISTPQNSSRFFTRGFLTNNDYSPTGDPLTITNFDTTGLNGTLDCTSDAFGCIYYPPSYFAGTTRFKYTVSDTHGHSDTAIVKVNVGTANTAPVAANDSLTTRANTPLTFSVFELLKNDVDAENDPLTVTVYTYPSPSHGTLSCSTPNYWCTYTPAAGYTGTDSFTYAVGDGIAYSNQATVTVTVQPVLAKDAVIVAQSVPASMTMGQSYPVSLTLKNIGTVAWSPIGPQCNAFRLGAANPYDNTTWGPLRTELPTTVAPGGQVTLSFNVTAPAAPGPYNFQRRMVHECVEWFGDLSPNAVVSVHP